MRSNPRFSERRTRPTVAAWTLQFGSMCCLLVAAVFVARAVAGFCSPDELVVIDRCCESESPTEEIEADQAGDEFVPACLSGSLMHLIAHPSQPLAGLPSARPGSPLFKSPLARGPPA